MTTKIRRGRDPEQHIVHNSPEEADLFIGLHGEISLVQDEDGITQLRAHDGYTAGGAVFIPAASELAEIFPARVALPPLDITVDDSGVFTIQHELGYKPIVQVLTAAGAVVAVQLLHDDDENLTLTFDPAPAAGTTEDYTVFIG